METGIPEISPGLPGDLMTGAKEFRFPPIHLNARVNFQFIVAGSTLTEICENKKK